MSEKRKIQRFNLDEGRIWEAIEGLSPFKTTYTLEEVCEKLNEQQFTIQSLKEENEQLRQQLQEYKENWDDMVELATKTSLRNVELDEQIGQLRKELGDCEKFRYAVFKRLNEEYIKEHSI